MKFHSPFRPTITNAGHPAYPYEAPLAALPGITIHPTAQGFRLSLWLITDTGRTCVEFSKYVALESAGYIIDYLRDYSEDPEKVMREVFGWGGVRAGQGQRADREAPLAPLALRAGGRRAGKTTTWAAALLCAQDMPDDTGI